MTKYGKLKYLLHLIDRALHMPSAYWVEGQGVTGEN